MARQTCMRRSWARKIWEPGFGSQNLGRRRDHTRPSNIVNKNPVSCAKNGAKYFRIVQTVLANLSL